MAAAAAVAVAAAVVHEAHSTRAAYLQAKGGVDNGGGLEVGALGDRTTAAQIEGLLNVRRRGERSGHDRCGHEFYVEGGGASRHNSEVDEDAH